MDRKRIDALIDKYLNGTSSPEETARLEKWLDMRSGQSDWSWEDENHKTDIRKEIFQNIDGKTRNYQTTNVFGRMWKYQRTIAAVLILGLTFGFWFLGRDKEEKRLPTLSQAVSPGTKAATLRMGDGEVIYLDDRGEGVLGEVDNIKISKQAGGVIQYNALGTTPAGKVLENTLFIPRGGQYKIKLSDGTDVWLNSETTLIYPTRFAGKERKVKLIGEAYFEVAKDAKQPFIVESGGMEILVTGTEFNVSAYGGSSETMTTLIAGSVVVHGRSNESMKLIPGQQAYQKADRAGLGKRSVNVNNIVSWKKGYFSFDYQNLEAVMDEVSRWYDIDYEIVGQPKQLEKLGGTFSREKSLDKLLIYLEQLINVRTKKQGRRVTLMY